MRQITDMALIRPLYDGWGDNLARSTLDGCMGRAWANDALTAAKIINGDFACIAGYPSAPEAEELVRFLPDDYASAWLLTVSKDDAWNGTIERALGEKASKIERYAIRRASGFDCERLQGFVEALPEGYTLAFIDEKLYAEAKRNDWSCDFVSQFANAADYVRRGLGVAVLHQGEMVAGASSYVVFGDGIEIEIDTLEAHRRKGLALACASKLILACMQRGLYPSWDASNLHSVALAEKLGYQLERPYATYSYHTGRS